MRKIRGRISDPRETLCVAGLGDMSSLYSYQRYCRKHAKPCPDSSPYGTKDLSYWEKVVSPIFSRAQEAHPIDQGAGGFLRLKLNQDHRASPSGPHHQADKHQIVTSKSSLLPGRSRTWRENFSEVQIHRENQRLKAIKKH